jgi:hypothetical protein
MAWYWIVLTVVGYAIAGGITVTLFELMFDDVIWGESIPLALAWPVILFVLTIIATEYVSLKIARSAIEKRKTRKYAKQQKLKGTPQMKTEIVEKYLVALKEGKAAEIDGKVVCGVKFSYGTNDYVKIGRSDEFDSELKAKLLKADETLIFYKDKFEISVPVGAIYSIVAYYDDRKVEIENAIEIVEAVPAI